MLKPTDDHAQPKQDTIRQGSDSGCCCEGDCGPKDPSRRDFLKIAGMATASMAATGQVACGGEAEIKIAPDHFVPVDKKLPAAWSKSLTAKGESTWYSGDDLNTIGMPIGGLCTSQLYLSGDGRLTHWNIFNDRAFSGYGRDNYKLGLSPDSPLAQGFAMQIKQGGKTVTRTLDREGFSNVRFCGEYPIGTVEYFDDAVPVTAKLEAFSPFIPLNTDDSSLPATLLQYTLKNTSDAPVEVTLAGWLENAVCINSGNELSGTRINFFAKSEQGRALNCRARAIEPEKTEREPKVLADFETANYGDWTVEGDAFGDGPAKGTLANQQTVSGFQGQGLINTYLGGNDQKTGKLTSPTFSIDRKFVSFLIGGGNEEGKTCINLIVDGQVVRTAVGKQNEKLEPHNWNVADLAGKQATIEIVDATRIPWGHINIDQVELRDTPRTEGGGPMEERTDYGTMSLAVLAAPTATDVVGWARLPEGKPQDTLFAAQPTVLPASRNDEAPRAEMRMPGRLIGALGRQVTLAPGEEQKIVFAITWCFPNRSYENRKVGNHYATKFANSLDTADYLAKNFERLDAQTRRWHATWYDSTMPHWLLDRLFSTASTMATGTSLRWANGRFWGWEGVGCCHGTCAHVWNYEHSMARLFPELERSVREMQDYSPEGGFVPETGMVRFRGEGWGMWAADGQAGTVLKALREHQVSADSTFLKRNWAKIRKSLEFLINEDADGDGLIEGRQHNTYDIDFYGANPMMGSLYLAALLAGEQMAQEMGDEDFAKQCREIFESGKKRSVERLYNGEYFIQEVDLEEHTKAQHGEGCLADQLFGQGWAHQVGLEYVYPKETILKTLESIWKYNWAPDIGPQNEAHKPERWFASPGEAGLFTCTWPRSPHLPQGVRYKNEIWTGIEYQVAGNLAWDGMVTEALAICRGVHDRYHPAKHNPWNEIECGDHYARGMASHGVFLGLCGFEYHGPKSHIGFAPRITPDDFRAAFTAAEGWGTLSQKRERMAAGSAQTNRIELNWGELRVKTIALELPEGQKVGKVDVLLLSQPVKATAKQEGTRVVVTLDIPTVVVAGQSISIVVT